MVAEIVSELRPLVMLALLCLLTAVSRLPAATLTSSPASPQPGDVLTLTVHPAPGEVLRTVILSAFDTPDVKFYSRKDRSERAFLGLPFDRKGGSYPLSAIVQVTRNGQTVQEKLPVVIHARARWFPTQYIRMQGSTASRMSDHAAFRAERERVQATMQDSASVPLWHGSWIVPATGISTSSYGRKRYVNGKWWGQHNGADIRAVTGTPVRATNSGRVVLSEYLPTLRGNCIVVDHGCNVFSVYMHLSRRLVTVGESVQRGQVIGRVGATGFVTGPHLHWEIRIGWEPVDPFRVARRGLSF